MSYRQVDGLSKILYLAARPAMPICSDITDSFRDSKTSGGVVHIYGLLGNNSVFLRSKCKSERASWIMVFIHAGFQLGMWIG